ncbi:hypothetical protein ES703_97346 [subsurface metagenome]
MLAVCHFAAALVPLELPCCPQHLARAQVKANHTFADLNVDPPAARAEGLRHRTGLRIRPFPQRLAGLDMHRHYRLVVRELKSSRKCRMFVSMLCHRRALQDEQDVVDKDDFFSAGGVAIGLQRIPRDRVHG